MVLIHILMIAYVQRMHLTIWLVDSKFWPTLWSSSLTVNSSFTSQDWHCLDDLRAVGQSAGCPSESLERSVTPKTCGGVGVHLGRRLLVLETSFDTASRVTGFASNSSTTKIRSMESIVQSYIYLQSATLLDPATQVLGFVMLFSFFLLQRNKFCLFDLGSDWG